MKSLDHWDMESQKGIKTGINSLKRVFKGQAIRVKCRSLGQMGEMNLNQGERALKNSQTRIKMKNRG